MDRRTNDPPAFHRPADARRAHVISTSKLALKCEPSHEAGCSSLCSAVPQPAPPLQGGLLRSHKLDGSMHVLLEQKDLPQIQNHVQSQFCIPPRPIKALAEKGQGGLALAAEPGDPRSSQYERDVMSRLLGRTNQLLCQGSAYSTGHHGVEPLKAHGAADVVEDVVSVLRDLCFRRLALQRVQRPVHAGDAALTLHVVDEPGRHSFCHGHVELAARGLAGEHLEDAPRAPQRQGVAPRVEDHDHATHLPHRVEERRVPPLVGPLDVGLVLRHREDVEPDDGVRAFEVP
mmetsp:Transcript_7706/g.23255  ORF Transcript_7706/g.23255 Transcript_7706/m.23255 type:complete len:288 (+) Transcript_7706:698-1561(+)